MGFVEKLAEVLDRGGRVDAIFLDMEKAFDKVDHKILIEKMEKVIGERRWISWIRDFLRGRTQTVKVGNAISAEEQITSGVPQGSVLGPYLFNIYVEDIEEGLSSTIRLFADDCVIYREVSSTADEAYLQNDLALVGEWVKNNKMGLNVAKSKVLSFSRKKVKIIPNYWISGQILEVVEKYKYLGVVFHRSLGWEEQIQRLAGRGIKTLNFKMRQLRGTDNSIKEKAYKTLVRPIVEYAASVWDPFRIGNVKAMERVQRIAARRVTGRVKKSRVELNKKGEEVIVWESPTEMVNELGWNTLEERRKVDRLCNFKRVMEGVGGWAELHKKIDLENGKVNSLRGHKKKVKVSRARTDVGKFSFLNRTSRDWNGLEAVLVEGDDSVRALRGSLLKTFNNSNR